MAFSLALKSLEDSDIVEVAAEGAATGVDFPLGTPGHFAGVLGHEWSARRVLLSMEHVSYIDSSAIGWLISSQKAFRAHGGALVLHSVQPAVRNVLDLLKIGRVVSLASDAGAGRALLREHPAVASTH